MAESLPPTVSTVVSATEAAPPSGEHLARGTAIGRYMVLEHLGEGGMGVVYKAYDPDLDRTIAIKLVRGAGRNPDQQQRLRTRLMREAQALARLSHPNVVGVFDVGPLGDGLFVAMEHVDGVTLSALLRQATPSLARVRELFLDAGRGLAAAHAVGIVHRDFKPENVIVARSGSARVLDFGLAQPSPDEVSTDDGQFAAAQTAVTEAGAVVGTPGYMSPEQRAGGDVDARGDQFSFCVALHEALFGARPTAEPDAIPARTLSGERIPPKLRDALRRGLSGARDDRFPTMRALLEQLAPPPRRAIWLAVAGVAVVLVVASAVIATRASAPPISCDGFESKLAGIWDAPRKAAVHAKLDPGTAATVDRLLDRYAAGTVASLTTSCRATYVLGEQSPELLDLRTQCLDRRLAALRELVDGLTSADTETANKAIANIHSLSPLDDCANATALREPEAPHDPVASRVLRRELGRLRGAFALGRYDEVDRGSRALVAAADHAGDGWLAAAAMYLGARASWALGRGDAAEDQLYRAIAVGESARASDIVAFAWTTLAWIAGEGRGRTADGLRLAAVARGILDRLGGSPVLEATLEDHLGVLYLDRGELAEARAHIARAIALRQQQFEKDSEYATALQHMALVERAAGKLDKALAMLREAYACEAAEVGNAHPGALAMLGAIGATLHDLGRDDEAAATLEPAIALAQDGSPTLASLLTNLGVTQWKRKHYDEAKAALLRAEAITDPASERATALETNLSLVYTDTRELAEARVHAQRAVDGIERHQGPDHLDLAMELDTLGTADLGTGHPDEALAAFERALAIRIRAKASASDIAWMKFEIAKATLATTHDVARARKLAEAAKAELEAADDPESVGEVAAWLKSPEDPARGTSTP